MQLADMQCNTMLIQLSKMYRNAFQLNAPECSTYASAKNCKCMNANADLSNAFSTECRKMKANRIFILFNAQRMHHNTCKETTRIV